MTDETASTRFAKDQLKAFIERIERLEDEKKTIADDIRDVYAEAKGNGFDVKALRAIVKLRKQDAQERQEQELILETYMNALGMLAGTPLGDAALDRVAKQGTSARMEPAREGRAQRAKARTSESMADTAELARDMAAEGLISEEAAAETVRIAEGVAKKFGNGSGEGGAPPVGGSTPPEAPPTPAAAASATAAHRADWQAPSLIEIDEFDIPPKLLRGHPEAWVQAGASV